MTEPTVRLPLRPLGRRLEHDGSTLRLVGECVSTGALLALTTQGFAAIPGGVPV
ncbi:hypothetical protein I7X12_11640 [Halosimplex litoreum]|uniref:Uncharacterized protein n=1 Tax=Halosimplex litoreum TaxID=1198301 RepID=A0A7T3KTW2_9EURY|nr:hypothetical protein [Halosimplex litoreum]QPV61419.1 hypothetical protein I7X12_11640 [Halosimplex litoreum]